MKTINYNAPRTGAEEFQDMKLLTPNYADDYRVIMDEPNEVRLANMKSPLTGVQVLRYGLTDIKNIYQNTGVDKPLQLPSKEGVALLVQLQERWTIKDDSDPSFEAIVPVTAHMVIKLPKYVEVKDTDLEHLIGTTVGCLFNSGSKDQEKIQALLRGALRPKSL